MVCHKRMFVNRANFFSFVLWRIIPVFSIGIVFIIVSENVPKGTKLELYLEESSSQRLVTAPEPTEEASSGPVKVLLVTYMRGGSTFLGELFNQNKDACYWYEPVEGMYHAMYGFLPLLQPLDLLYYPNQTKRARTKYEKENIYRYLQQLFTDADIGKFPLELLFSRVVLDRHIKWTEPLRACLRPKFRVKMNWIMTFKRRHCRKCLPEPKLQNLASCYKDTLHQEEKFINVTTSQVSTCPTKKITCHKECMELIGDKTFPCLKNVHKLCANKSISAIKVVRLTNEMMGDILKKDSTIKVVYYIRDPRAVFVSRREAGKWMHSGVSRRNWMNEVKLLCKRMLEDYQHFQKLKFSYPNNVLSMSYENFAQKPLEYANQVYKLIGVPLPGEVAKWLKENTMATKDAGDFDTTRRNSTATALAWRNKMTSEQISLINTHCEKVLNVFGYPLNFSKP